MGPSKVGSLEACLKVSPISVIGVKKGHMEIDALVLAPPLGTPRTLNEDKIIATIKNISLYHRCEDGERWVG